MTDDGRTGGSLR